MASLGGGGHHTAASATITGMTLYQVREKLLELLRHFCPGKRTVRDIMFTPPRMVPPETTVKEASIRVNRAQVNNLCVVAHGNLLGTLTRKIIDKAMYHHLDDTPVSAYMITDFTSLSPDTSIEEAKTHFVTSGVVFAPVVKNDKAMGEIGRAHV